jgi:hypothetical protein
MMVWLTELTSCSPLRQGEKRIESSLRFYLDVEKKLSVESLDDGVYVKHRCMRPELRSVRHPAAMAHGKRRRGHSVGLCWSREDERVRVGWRWPLGREVGRARIGWKGCWAAMCENQSGLGAGEKASRVGRSALRKLGQAAF